jgi:3-oxoacyl-[acyl-carrier protein] reductase
MDLGLKGKVAIVTGASAGIGSGVARALACESVHTVLVARREGLLRALAAEISAAGGPDPVIVAGDLTVPAFTEEVRAAAVSRLGRIDIVVNNAGGTRPVTTASGDDDWNEAMRLNFFAARRLTHACLDDLRASGAGRIINVTGSSEPRVLSAASPAKAATHVWAKALSNEVARDGITVNCVAPGRIETEQILERVFPDRALMDDYARTSIPVGRFGQPSDIGRVVAFLASPESGYLTGEIIHVDGGYRRHAL